MKHMPVILIDCWIRCCRLCAPVQLPCLGHCNAADSVTAGNVGHADKVMAGSVRHACCRIRPSGEMEAGLPASSFVATVCLYMAKGPPTFVFTPWIASAPLYIAAVLPSVLQT